MKLRLSLVKTTIQITETSVVPFLIFRNQTTRQTKSYLDETIISSLPFILVPSLLNLNLRFEYSFIEEAALLNILFVSGRFLQDKRNRGAKRRSHLKNNKIHIKMNKNARQEAHICHYL